MKPLMATSCLRVGPNDLGKQETTGLNSRAPSLNPKPPTSSINDSTVFNYRRLFDVPFSEQASIGFLWTAWGIVCRLSLSWSGSEAAGLALCTEGAHMAARRRPAQELVLLWRCAACTNRRPWSISNHAPFLYFDLVQWLGRAIDTKPMKWLCCWFDHSITDRTVD